MVSNFIYKPRDFDLSGLKGISDKTLDMHFKLYSGYVTQTNTLNTRIAEIVGTGHIEKDRFPAYSELTRHLGFEYNGMVLHEYYFDNLKKGGSTGSPAQNSVFRKGTEESFGSYDIWKADFTNLGRMRGVGWAICYQDPNSGRLSNHWVDLHDAGNVASFKPLLVMDVWEHAYLLDYKPSERSKYIEAFFTNIKWETVNQRMIQGKLASTA